MSPIKAFLVLGAVVAATIGVIIATRPDPAPPAEPATSTTVPTEAEAIKIFNRLEARLDQAYEARDSSLLSGIYVAGSTVSEIAARDINQLRRDNVMVETTSKEHSIEATQLRRGAIVLLQDVTLDARFVRPNGKELSSTSERQRVRWHLVLLNEGWRIRDAEVIEATA